jgi:hypothetical protein
MYGPHASTGLPDSGSRGYNKLDNGPEMVVLCDIHQMAICCFIHAPVYGFEYP